MRHVSIRDFKKTKNLILRIVTRVSARDYTTRVSIPYLYDFIKDLNQKLLFVKGYQQSEHT